MGGVSPVGAGAHGLGLPAASPCWFLLNQLAPLELWPDARMCSVPRGKDYAKERNKMNRNRLCGGEKCMLPSVKCLKDDGGKKKKKKRKRRQTHFLAGVAPNCKSNTGREKSDVT